MQRGARSLALMVVLSGALGGLALALLATEAGGVAVAPGGAVGADLAMADPELALVAGLARGPSVLGIPLAAAPGEVLAVPADAPEELGALEATGRTFDFTDPNGRGWHVVEYAAPWGHAYATQVGDEARDPTVGAYNFVLLVDQGKVGSAVRVVAR